MTALDRTLEGLTMVGTNGGSRAVFNAVLHLIDKACSLARQEARELLGAATLVAIEVFDAKVTGTCCMAFFIHSWLRGACRILGAEVAERVA